MSREQKTARAGQTQRGFDVRGGKGVPEPAGAMDRMQSHGGGWVVDPLSSNWGPWISRHEIQVMGQVDVNVVVVVESWEKAGERARPGLKLRRMESRLRELRCGEDKHSGEGWGWVE